MTSICGDDLVAARRFTNLCERHMSKILSSDRLALSDVLSLLSDIQSHAKLMQARMIYKASQKFIDDLINHKSADDCARSMQTLKHIIGEYEKGLSEIAPKRDEKPIKVKSSVYESKSSEVSAIARGATYVTDVSRQKHVMEILRPLIKFAKGEDQKNLIRLMNFGANGENAPKRSYGLQKNIPQKFGSIMPMVTNSWLRLARTQDKTISVSVCDGDVSIRRELLDVLQKQMEILGQWLIDECVETPEKRSEQGLSRSAHIAVTAKRNGDFTDVLMSCEGELPTTINIETMEEAIAKIGGHFYLSQKTGLVRAEIFKIPLFKLSDNHDVKVKEVAL